ncbi:hypothetical protein P7C70_g6315, partial [Phenoliferia sp. Uapishka_3]
MMHHLLSASRDILNDSGKDFPGGYTWDSPASSRSSHSSTSNSPRISQQPTPRSSISNGSTTLRLPSINEMLRQADSGHRHPPPHNFFPTKSLSPTAHSVPSFTELVSLSADRLSSIRREIERPSESSLRRTSMMMSGTSHQQYHQSAYPSPVESPYSTLPRSPLLPGSISSSPSEDWNFLPSVKGSPPSPSESNTQSKRRRRRTSDFAPNQLSKRFACTFPGCGKTLARPSALNTHLRTHSQERPYACPVDWCNRGFSVYSNMVRHQRLCNHPTPPGHPSLLRTGPSGRAVKAQGQPHTTPNSSQDA